METSSASEARLAWSLFLGPLRIGEEDAQMPNIGHVKSMARWPFVLCTHMPFGEFMPQQSRCQQRSKPEPPFFPSPPLVYIVDTKSQTVRRTPFRSLCLPPKSHLLRGLPIQAASGFLGAWTGDFEFSTRRGAYSSLRSAHAHVLEPIRSAVLLIKEGFAVGKATGGAALALRRVGAVEERDVLVANIAEPVQSQLRC